MKPLPKLDDLKNKFRYDPETGEFFTATGYPATRYVQKNGYIALFFGRYLQTHRVAWLLMTGDDPYGFEVDHINGVAGDNRWINLRKVTKSQNALNLPCPKSNKLGIKGVWKNRGGRFNSSIMRDRKSIWLGTFNTAEEASAAYQKAAEELHGEFRRMNTNFVQLGA